MKELKQTSGLMQSSFYKARFAAEYLQVDTRLRKLINMCKAWDEGTLNFTPTCPRALYDKQIAAMEEYRAILKERAKLENVNLAEYEQDTHDFAWAMQRMLEGEKVALPEWGGYWFLDQDGMISLYTKEGTTLKTPMYDRYAQRRDWKIWDEINKKQLEDFQSKLV